MSEIEIQLARFMEDLVRRNVSAHTRRAYACDLKTLPAFTQTTELADINIGHMRAWLASLHDDRKLGAVSIRRHIASCRTFFQFLSRNGLVTINPACLLHLPKKPGRLPAVLSAKQLGALIDHIEPLDLRQPVRDLTIFELLYGCGLRVSELVGLNVQDIDRAECWLLIRGKGKKERQVPYGDKAKEALERYLAYRSEYVLPGYFNPRAREKRIQIGARHADPLLDALFLNSSRKRLSVRGWAIS